LYKDGFLKIRGDFAKYDQNFVDKNSGLSIKTPNPYMAVGYLGVDETHDYFQFKFYKRFFYLDLSQYVSDYLMDQSKSFRFKVFMKSFGYFQIGFIHHVNWKHDRQFSENLPFFAFQDPNSNLNIHFSFPEVVNKNNLVDTIHRHLDFENCAGYCTCPSGKIYPITEDIDFESKQCGIKCFGGYSSFCSSEFTKYEMSDFQIITQEISTKMEVECVDHYKKIE
jgi:hypothetical protein